MPAPGSSSPAERQKACCLIRVGTLRFDHNSLLAADAWVARLQAEAVAARHATGKGPER